MANVDEFLKTAAPAAKFLATIEATTDPLLVKVTPWLNGDCRCDASLTVPKAAIADVKATNDTHSCCGKRLIVGDVTFADGNASLPHIFDQLLARRAPVATTMSARGQRDATTRLTAGGDCAEDCYEEFRWCRENCGNGFPCYTCKNYLMGCLRNCRE